MITQALDYRPAFEYPPPRTAAEQMRAYRSWAVPNGAAWVALNLANTAFLIGQGAWARIDLRDVFDPGGHRGLSDRAGGVRRVSAAHEGPRDSGL